MTDLPEGMNVLPEFPVDDTTLDMLWAALHPGPEAERTSVSDFLELMSQLGGSDTKAVAEMLDDHTALMRDQHYHEHNVLTALIVEIRHLRKLERAVFAWRQWYPRGEGEHADNLARRYDEFVREARF